MRFLLKARSMISLLPVTIHKRKRTELAKKKELLMVRYRENPVDARLALEIKSLNDEIATLEGLKNKRK
jgi:hypothetical protein